MTDIPKDLTTKVLEAMATGDRDKEDEAEEDPAGAVGVGGCPTDTLEEEEKGEEEMGTPTDTEETGGEKEEEEDTVMATAEEGVATEEVTTRHTQITEVETAEAPLEADRCVEEEGCPVVDSEAVPVATLPRHQSKR